MTHTIHELSLLFHTAETANNAAPGRLGAGRRRWPALPCALLLVVSAPLAAEPPSFRFPLDCEPGRDCFVQNHVDVDPGPLARDFTCGPLTYDGHRGTDIRVRNLAEMARGVDVLAAAAGRVVSARDGMADDGGRDPALTRKCGNGVGISHGGGWTSLYCHMRKGSIRVTVGERVEAGHVLGRIGLSGRTDFPPLHFGVAVKKRPVDPYTGRLADGACDGMSGAEPLWSRETMARLGYRFSGLLGAGFSLEQPEWDKVRAGAYRQGELAAGGSKLFFWVEVFGLRSGDVEVMRMVAPAGRVLAEKRFPPASKNRAIQRHYIGSRRRSGKTWPAGRYSAQYRLLRPGADGGGLHTVLSEAVSARLE